jgi:hypothetical protein
LKIIAPSWLPKNMIILLSTYHLNSLEATPHIDRD